MTPGNNIREDLANQAVKLPYVIHGQFVEIPGLSRIDILISMLLIYYYHHHHHYHCNYYYYYLIMSIMATALPTC